MKRRQTKRKKKKKLLCILLQSAPISLSFLPVFSLFPPLVFYHSIPRVFFSRFLFIVIFRNRKMESYQQLVGVAARMITKLIRLYYDSSDVGYDEIPQGEVVENPTWMEFFDIFCVLCSFPLSSFLLLLLFYLLSVVTSGFYFSLSPLLFSFTSFSSSSSFPFTFSI